MVYLSDETVVLEQTKSYTDMACTACAQALGGHVPNRGCEDCWSECTFTVDFLVYLCMHVVCSSAWEHSALGIHLWVLGSQQKCVPVWIRALHNLASVCALEHALSVCVCY